MAWTATVRLEEPSFDRVETVLSGLDIETFESDGRFTVLSRSEPQFCFVRGSLAEIDAIVIDTLTSYLRTFWDIEVLDLPLAATSIPLPAIPVERLKPVSKIRPSFRVKDSQGRQREIA